MLLLWKKCGLYACCCTSNTRFGEVCAAEGNMALMASDYGIGAELLLLRGT